MKLSEKFIKATDELCDFDNYVNAPYIRKKFSVDFTPQKAEITICGLGFYELYINGVNITKGPLAPYISNTDDICYYDNYDISDLLNEGDNVIGILLGNGMRNPFGGFIWDYHTAPHRGAVTAALCMEVSDGENTLEIEADESFKTHPSPIIYDDLRMGYIYDSRLEIENWNKVDFDDTEWNYVIKEKTPKGIKKLCKAEPIAVTETLAPISVKHYDELPFAYKDYSVNAEPIESTVRKDVYVYDFGVNAAGVTRLKINGKPGQKITIRHGESLINDSFSVNSTVFSGRGERLDNIYLEMGQTDIFICKGGEEEFVPRFKYDGFRYAYVEGLLPEQATKDALTYIVMNSDIKERAAFECSDEVLNKLQQCTRRADLSNMYYFPTDCPHREKNGWTADASFSAEHMLLNLTVEESFKEWMANIRMAQNADGALPGIVPTGGWGFEWGNGPAWDAVCVNVPYYVYKYTGDKEIIEENVSLIMRYLYYVSAKRDENGLIAIGLGDWVDPFEKQNGKIASPLIFTDSAMIHDIARKAAFLFGEIGKDKESAYADELANDMRNAIRGHLIDFDTMTVDGNCQTSQAVALETGLFDEKELTEARKKLVEIIHRDGDVNACGVIGLRYVFHALTNAGKSELAYKIITGKSRTCYGYWIEHGATALWESFMAEGETEINSQNHHFLGDVSSWFIQELAGIKPNPNCDDTSYFEIVPDFINRLSHAKAYYDSKYGRIGSEWNRVGDGIELKLIIPPGTHGRVVLKSGYEFDDGTDGKKWSKQNNGSTDLTYILKVGTSAF